MDQLPLVLLLLAALLVAGGMALARASGSHVSLGRRLAGASPARVGDLLGPASLPGRPVRVAGRVRCPDPMITASDDRLVALHRDVEVRLGDGRWRSIERLRETRGMELWDHDGSLALDLSEAAEPLVAIPHVWRGEVSELTDAPHAAAVARLVEEGLRPVDARSVTRSISVVDRLLVLARPVRTPEGDVVLEPPPGGYVVSALELPDAMRLLGGKRRARLLGGAALIGAGTLVALVAVLAWALGAFA